MNIAIHPVDSRRILEPDNGGSDARSRSKPVETSVPCAISSEDLLRGQPSVTITHQGAIYRLQTTRQGKLILTK
jgi:hemin uptake protein HemP